MNYNFFLIPFLAIASPAQAIIISTHEISDVKNYVHENTLVVYDFHETLVDLKEYQLTHDYLPDLLNEIAQKGAKQIVLTAQPTRGLDVTIAQLLSLGLDFSKATLYDAEIPTPPGNHQCTNPDHKHDYKSQAKSGVICCDANNKGKIICAYLDCGPHTITDIVFIDNRYDHVENVHTHVLEKGLNCTSIHYLGPLAIAD